MFRLSWRAQVRRTLVAAGLGLAVALTPAAAGATESESNPTRVRTSDRCEDPGAGIVGLLFRAPIEAHCFVKERRARAATASTPTPAVLQGAPEPDAAIDADADAAGEAGVAAPEPPSPNPCPPPGVEARPVEAIVAEVFRCRLLEAGWSEEDARRVAAEALVVAACESYLDPASVVFDGRYRDVPHPNGNRYSAAGLFQFIRWTADLFIEGGYANVHDPVLNADAAARLYLYNVNAGRPGWADWACVMVNDGFAKQSVLPGWPGGPAELPAWAWEH